MWMEELSNGKYKYFERYTDPLTEQKKRVSVTLTKSTPQAKKEAQRLLNEKIEIKLQNSHHKKVTFQEVYEEWFAIYQNTVKTTSSIKVKYAMKHINKTIEPNVLLDKIDNRLIQKLVNELYYKQNYSFSYTESIKVVLGMILEHGVECGYINTNPTKKIKLKRKPKTLEEIERIENKYLEKHEVESILKEMRKSPKSQRNADIVELIFYTGLRIGELLGLKYEDYNSDSIEVRGTLDYTTNKLSDGIKGTTKNQASMRKIDLPDRAKQILDRVMLENELATHATTIYNDKGFFFTSCTGSPVAVSTINYSLQNVAKKINLKKHLTTHIFRHSHISLLSELGIPIKAIMDRVGHSDADTTLKIYTHVTENMKTNVIEKLNTVSL